MRIDFPDGFWWGAATAAHQVEGDNTNSDWWRAEQAGTVDFPSGRACEQYERYESDFDLAVELGHNAHRLSVEWARIEPEPGVFDAEQIAHYARVLAALKARGLTTFVTLHHFTNPAWFADLGGWEAADAPQLFERYVREVAPPLAEHVDVWLTINEPTTVPQQGYIVGAWPPHRRWAARAALGVIDAQADAHVRAYRAIHELVSDATVGYTVTFVNWRPKNPRSAWQRFLARKLAGITNFRFSDRVDGAHDLIGLQYYFTLPVGWRPFGTGSIPTAEKTDLGWDIVPEGLGDVTRSAWERYRTPIVITENGLADAADSRREAFITEHLRALHGAMDDGADVRGYLHWSLVDNFEWSYGYVPRFGLVAIDYETQERAVRPSAWAYKRIITGGGFEVEERKMQLLDEKEWEIAVHEYDALRTELERHENANLEMLKLALTGAVVIISFSIQQWGAGNQAAWAIAATVPLVVLPAGIFSLSRAKMEMRIGAYLRVFFEERTPALNWEECLRERSKKDHWPDTLYAAGMFGGYALVGVAGLAVAWLLVAHTTIAHQVLRVENVVISALLVVAFAILVTSKRDSLGTEDMEMFRDLRNDPKRKRDLRKER